MFHTLISDRVSQTEFERAMSISDTDYLCALWHRNLVENKFNPAFSKIQVFLIGFLISAPESEARQEIIFLMAISSIIFARK